MAYLVKCFLCYTLSLHHRRCLMYNRTFLCPICFPDFDKETTFPLDSWVVITRLGHSDKPREYHSCCRKRKKEDENARNTYSHVD
jgi:hypothetical protein